ncbi:uncharacterized protein LOC144715322 [Wolffia australiana]
MEAQSCHQPHDEASGAAGAAGKSSFLCRQSSSRWIPTTDQIRILRDLYYNCGVRSPSAEQIQRISARLRQFGKIEGKNVFYWFQNHKARERQKKRLTVEVASNNKFTNPPPIISPGGLQSTCTSPGLYFANERSYVEYAFQGGANGGSTGEQPALYYHHQKTSAYYFEQESLRHQAAAAPPHIETLPLFPVRAEEDNFLAYHFSPSYVDQSRQEEEERRCFRVFCNGGDGGASLELSLYSYGALPTTSS